MTITSDGEEGSLLPPSQRDLSNLDAFVRAHHRNLRILGQGFTTGRLVTPRAVTSTADNEDPTSQDGGGESADDTQYEWQWDDRHTITATGTQVVRLSEIPVDESLFVRWHPAGGAGVPVINEYFTIEDQTVTIPDPGVFAIGDLFSFQYQFDPGVEEAEPTLDSLILATNEIADTLEGYWRMADTSGTTITESTGKSGGIGSTREGTYSTGYTLGHPGLDDSAPEDTSVGLVSPNELYRGFQNWQNFPSGDISIFGLIRPTTTVGGGAQTLMARDNNGTHGPWVFYLQNNGKLGWLWNWHGSFPFLSPYSVSGSTVLTAGQRYAVGITYNGTTEAWKLYLGAVPDASGVQVGAGPLQTDPSQRITWGGINGFNYLQGDTGKWAIWSDVRTDDDFAAFATIAGVP